MLASRLVGRDASTKKYDLLTALATFALSQDKGMQRLVLRLMVLITARYNWRRNELSMGRKEIARIWSVDERTVKREMSKLRNLGWVKVKVPAARGRVAVYSIEFNLISAETEGIWSSVGPDFVERMSALYPQTEVKVVKVDFGARKIEGPEVDPETGDRGKWRAVRGLLRDADPDVFRNWYDNLVFSEFCDGVMSLQTPNRFLANHIKTHHSVPLLTVSKSIFKDVVSIQIEPIP